VGCGEKINFPKKKTTEIKADKGQRKKFNLGWHKDSKENPNLKYLAIFFKRREFFKKKNSIFKFVLNFFLGKN